tara:strand:- start:14 stop:343 length:330 start_codon:yes stop_codon:yes gene_type:complete
MVFYFKKMNFIVENFYCWTRPKKKELEKPKKNEFNIKIKPELTCAGCFKCIESMDEFTQITKIGKNYFGVCSDECYKHWLRSPGAQTLAPISNYEVYITNLNKDAANQE